MSTNPMIQSPTDQFDPPLALVHGEEIGGASKIDEGVTSSC